MKTISRTPIRTARLQELKEEGHELIDQLVKMGVRRDSVYESVRRRLGRRGDLKAGHFKYANTIKECELIIKQLNLLIEKKKVGKIKKQIKSSLEQYKAEHPKLTRWQKFKLWIFRI